MIVSQEAAGHDDGQGGKASTRSNVMGESQDEKIARQKIEERDERSRQRTAQLTEAEAELLKKTEHAEAQSAYKREGDAIGKDVPKGAGTAPSASAQVLTTATEGGEGKGGAEPARVVPPAAALTPGEFARIPGTDATVESRYTAGSHGGFGGSALTSRDDLADGGDPDGEERGATTRRGDPSPPPHEVPAFAVPRTPFGVHGDGHMKVGTAEEQQEFKDKLRMASLRTQGLTTDGRSTSPVGDANPTVKYSFNLGAGVDAEDSAGPDTGGAREDDGQRSPAESEESDMSERTGRIQKRIAKQVIGAIEERESELIQKLGGHLYTQRQEMFAVTQEITDSVNDSRLGTARSVNAVHGSIEDISGQLAELREALIMEADERRAERERRVTSLQNPPIGAIYRGLNMDGEPQWDTSGAAKKEDTEGMDRQRAQAQSSGLTGWDHQRAQAQMVEPEPVPHWPQPPGAVSRGFIGGGASASVAPDTTTERVSQPGFQVPRTVIDLSLDEGDTPGNGGDQDPSEGEDPSDDPEDHWIELAISDLRDQYSRATEPSVQNELIMRMAMIRSMDKKSPAKRDIRNHVSTEKLWKQEEFKGALNKQMLAERLWYDSHVRTYLSHASPNGGVALFKAIQKKAYPIAIALSQATTSEERARAHHTLDSITKPPELDKEITNRFPAVFERAMSKETTRYFNEHLSTTLGSHKREPLCVMVAWRVASMLANGPRCPADWLRLTNYVEAPVRVLRDADTTTILACWREWHALAVETQALGLTAPARIAPGMKECLSEFMSYMTDESKYKLRAAGLFTEGLDHRQTSWKQLNNVYEQMYAKCGFLIDEPHLQRYLRRSAHGAHVGKQVSVNPHPTPTDKRTKGRSPTPPSRQPSSGSRSRSQSRSRSRSASVASNASATSGKKGGKASTTPAANAGVDNRRKKQKQKRASVAKAKSEAAAADMAAAAKPGARSRTPTPRRKSHSPGAHAGKQDIPLGTCFDFVRTGKCERGAKCSYTHPKAAAARAPTPRGASQERGKGTDKEGPNPSWMCFNCGKPGHQFKDCKHPRPKGPQQCHFFKMNGRCQNGKDCRYLHGDKSQASPAQVDKPPDKSVGEKDQTKAADFP